MKTMRRHSASAQASSSPNRRAGTLYDRQFAGGWSRNKIAGAEQIEKFFAREPSVLLDEFMLHHGNVCRRTAKSRGAQLQRKIASSLSGTEWPLADLLLFAKNITGPVRQSGGSA
jgi:hypothetical protein